MFKAKAGQWECQDCEKRFLPEASNWSPAAPLLSENAQHPLRIFFSYGHDENKELVDLFKADFERRGHEVWIDYKRIGTWDDWRGNITRGIDGSHLAIAFMSKYGLRDPGVCRNEIELALHRFGEVYPVAVETVVMADIPIGIRHLQWPDLGQWRSIRDGLVPGEAWGTWYEARLIEMISKIEGQGHEGLGSSAADNEALREVLSPASFESKLAQHVEGFVGREWVFDAYEEWLQRPDSRLFWLKAGPGVGKTAIAAQLVMRQRGTVIGSWFADAKSGELCNPVNAILTLAFQWALRWPDYRTRLLRVLGLTAYTAPELRVQLRKDLTKRNPQDLFRYLIVEPSQGLIWREHKLVVVIDALDEATDAQGGNPLTDFLAQQLGSLPCWVGFVVTSRPDPGVAARLQGFKPFTINAQDDRNLADLRTWYDGRLAPLSTLAELSTAKQKWVRDLVLERSEGMMLYLRLVYEGLQEGAITFEKLTDMPPGLPGLYSQYAISFQHRFGDYYDNGSKPLLRLLAAAPGPLPEDLAVEIIGCDTEALHSTGLRLGSYIVSAPYGLELFHKTLREWLTHSADNRFWVDAEMGRQLIADALFTELDKSGNAYLLRWRKLIIEWLPGLLASAVQKGSPERFKKLGDVLMDLWQYATAERLYREALRLQRVTLPAGHSGIARSIADLAKLLLATGRHNEAEPLYLEAIALLRNNTQNNPIELAQCLQGLGELMHFNYEEAEPLFREALTLRRTALSAGHTDIATTLQRLSRVLLHKSLALPLTDSFSGAKRSLEDESWSMHSEANSIWDSVLNKQLSDGPARLCDVAYFLNQRKHIEGAIPLYQEVLKTQRALLAKGDPIIEASTYHLAEVLERIERYHEAEELYREVLAMNRSAPTKTTAEIADSIDNLARLLEKMNRPDEAEPLFRESLALRRNGTTNTQFFHTYDISKSIENLARVLEAINRYEEAEHLYRECLAIHRETSSRDDIARCLENLIRLLQKKEPSGTNTGDIEALRAEFLAKSDFISPEGFACITRGKFSEIYLVQNEEYPGYKVSLAFELDDFDRADRLSEEPRILSEEDDVEFLGMPDDYFTPKAPLWGLPLELVRMSSRECGLLPIVRAAEKLKTMPPEERVVQTLAVLETSIADYHRRRARVAGI